MAALTPKKAATNARYLAKFRTVAVRIPHEEAEEMERLAQCAGESLSGYIATAARMRAHTNDDTIRISVPRDQIQPLADAAGMTAKQYLAQALQDALTK